MSTTVDSKDDLIREAPASTVFRFAPLIKRGRSFLRIDWDDRDALFGQMDRRETAPI